MLTVSRSRTIAAPAEELWEVIRDPHHLPRWWPRVTRVEDVTLTGTGEDGAFTEVMRTRKGKLVRADFTVVACDDVERSLTWAQQVEGTPFARLLRSAETDVRLEPTAAGDPASAERAGGMATEVKIELRQVLSGGFPRFGGHMVRRAAKATIDEALDGLERIGG
ncbi:MAG TPA: SRPBCC family protein [Solirubrobacteraceae bacterium]